MYFEQGISFLSRLLMLVHVPVVSDQYDYLLMYRHDEPPRRKETVSCKAKSSLFSNLDLYILSFCAFYLCSRRFRVFSVLKEIAH